MYTDKAYDKRARRQALEEQVIECGILHRPNPGYPLTCKQIDFNKRMSKLQALVEHVLGILKLHYGLRKTRYLGLTKTAVQITLAVMAMNIKRALVLAKT